MYCDAKCRGRAYAARKASTPEGAAVVDLAIAPPPADEEPTLLDAVRQELITADRLNTVAGRRAITLVKRIIDPLSSSSSVATLDKQLSVVLAQALEGTQQREPDLLDQLEQRRLAKVNGA